MAFAKASNMSRAATLYHSLYLKKYNPNSKNIHSHGHQSKIYRSRIAHWIPFLGERVFEGNSIPT